MKAARCAPTLCGGKSDDLAADTAAAGAAVWINYTTAAGPGRPFLVARRCLGMNPRLLERLAKRRSQDAGRHGNQADA